MVNIEDNISADGRVVLQRCFAAFIPESRRTARDILLRNAQTRGSLCPPQWATTRTPLLCIPLHGRTGTFISDVQETTNAVPDCFQNRYKRPPS